MKKYVKFTLEKLFFKTVLVFIDLFYRYHYPLFSSTQMACEIMSVQDVV